MLNTTLLLGFIAAALIVLILPGPGVLYVIARSLSQGHRAGLASVVGLSAGALIHIAAAAIGLSAILITSATAFNLVKILGAGYLVYLGLRAILSKQGSPNIDVASDHSYTRLFMDGVVVSIFNPKIAIFFLAFLPQFVDQSLGNITSQVTLLGLIYVCLALLTDGTYALLAGHLRHWVSGAVLKGPWTRYTTGGIYIGLGINAAFTGRRA